MKAPTLQGRQRRIRNFIDTLFEAHLDPESIRPTLGGLADCLTDEETTGLPRDELLAVEPEPYRPHPVGKLRRGDGADIWAHLSDTGCYLHIPSGFVVRYKFEIYEAHAMLALQAAPQLRGLELSENFSEFPIDRLIIDPAMIAILMSDQRRHSDIEMPVS
jgi:hypothetical protein